MIIAWHVSGTGVVEKSLYIYMRRGNHLYNQLKHQIKKLLALIGISDEKEMQGRKQSLFFCVSPNDEPKTLREKKKTGL